MIIKQFLFGDVPSTDLEVGDDVTCAGCVRFHERNMQGEKESYCTMYGKGPVSANDKHCDQYWDRELYERARDEYEQRKEEERLARIEANKDKPPVEIGWGAEYDYVTDSAVMVPECPVCHEMPYSLEECYFCGTKFIQDDPALIEYKANNGRTKEELSTCLECKGVLHTISIMRNGEWRVANGWCEGCGMRFIV